MDDLSQYRGKRTLVCGGRDYSDETTIAVVLSEIVPGTLIHGGAPGADSLADKWWRRSRSNVPLTYEAEWRKFGRRAGPIRNARMLAEGKPDVVVAFPGRYGTEDMVTKAKAAGVPVLRVQRDGSVKLDVFNPVLTKEEVSK